MKQKYQVTLFCVDKKYRPVSCLVEVEQLQEIDLTEDKTRKKELQLTGIKKICTQKYWSKSDLIKFGYTHAKVRLYDKKKIDAENAATYEAIKEKKYSTGEWKRPKNK